MPQTLAEKVWERHVVHRADGEPDLLYVDLHLVHEVTSPQAFDGLRLHGRPVRRADLTVATMDHNVPTTDGPVTDEISARQMEALQRNADEFGVTLYPWGSAGQGIVHVIGPEMGYTQPGMTIVCGDSHTSTHGAFGALAFGIGTSEVEHVLATQTLPQTKAKTMAVTVDGELPLGCSAKDIILAIINRIGTGGGVGPRDRVPRLRDPRALDGGAHDDLQHVDRGRRARRDGGARRHDLRLRRGAPARAEGRRLGGRARRLAVAPHRRGRDVRHRGDARRRCAEALRQLGHEPRAVGHDRRGGARPRCVRRSREARGRGARARLHGPRAGHADARGQPEHGVHRVLHELAHGGPARRREGDRGSPRSPTGSAAWWSPARSP